MADPVNEVLIDAAISHALLLERLKNFLALQAVGIFNREGVEEVLATTRRRLRKVKTRGLLSGVTTQKGVRELHRQNARIIQDAFRQVEAYLVPELRDLAVVEAAWQGKTIETAVRSAIPFEVALNRPNQNTLRAIVSNEPILGKPLSQWFTGLTRSTADAIRREVNVGLLAGQTPDQIVRRLGGTRAARYTDGLVQTPRRHLRTLTRTSVTQITTDARERVFAENQDVIAAVKLVATLDARTTPICMSLDGEIYPILEGPRPPFHHQCRTVTVPQMKSWKELGIPAKEAPPSTRGALGGPVKETVTYPEWLRRQPVKTQELALGRTRARLFREGKVEIRQMVDPQGKTYSLRELAQVEGVAIP